MKTIPLRFCTVIAVCFIIKIFNVKEPKRLKNNNNNKKDHKRKRKEKKNMARIGFELGMMRSPVQALSRCATEPRSIIRTIFRVFIILCYGELKMTVYPTKNL
jgi:hypothetical protein